MIYKIVIIALLLLNSPYSEGYEEGYAEGWCYDEPQPEYCVAPHAPTPPSPVTGRDTYRDGYNDGFIQGQKDKEDGL